MPVKKHKVCRISLYGIHKAAILVFFSFHSSNITEKFLNVNLLATIPRIQIDGFYKGKGRFNMLNMNSRVFFNLTMGRLHCHSLFV